MIVNSRSLWLSILILFPWFAFPKNSEKAIIDLSTSYSFCTSSFIIWPGGLGICPFNFLLQSVNLNNQIFKSSIFQGQPGSGGWWWCFELIGTLHTSYFKYKKWIPHPAWTHAHVWILTVIDCPHCLCILDLKAWFTEMSNWIQFW